MSEWTEVALGGLFRILLIASPFVVFYVIPKAWKKLKTIREDDRAVVGALEDGSYIYKTEDGRYFRAIDESAIPVLINEEEGDRLWKQATELKYAKDN